MQKVGKYLLFFSGWLATLFVGILEVPQKVHSFFGTLPAAKHDVLTWWNLNTDFSGAWTNEGDITATEMMPIALRMRVYGGRIDGEVWSDGLRDTIHPVILLGGDLRDGALHAYAFDFVGGKETVFATFNITKVGDKLILKTLDQPAKLFPEHAELFANPDALKDKPLTNFEMIQGLLKQLKKK